MFLLLRRAYMHCMRRSAYPNSYMYPTSNSPFIPKQLLFTFRPQKYFFEFYYNIFCWCASIIVRCGGDSYVGLECLCRIEFYAAIKNLCEFVSIYFIKKTCFYLFIWPKLMTEEVMYNTCIICSYNCFCVIISWSTNEWWIFSAAL
jgi:hypothetical protein